MAPNSSPQRTLCLMTTLCFFLLFCVGVSAAFSINPKTCDVRRSSTKPLYACLQETSPDRDSIQDLHQSLSNGPQLSRSRFLALSASSLLMAMSVPPSTGATPSSSESPTSLQENSSSLTNGLVSSKTDGGSTTLEESVSGFVAGATLAAAKTVIKYPLDTATVRLQMPGTDYSIWNLGPLFDGSFSGISAPLLSNIPGGAIFFAVKDAAKTTLKDSGLPKVLITSLAVAAAQCPYWLVRNPSEVIKTRQQAGIEGYGEGVSVLDAFRLVRDEAKAKGGKGTGVEGLYVGYWENILYALPADVVKFVCYDSLTKGRKDISPQEGAMAGAAATAIAQFVTTPLDVVRNRKMAGEGASISVTETFSGSYWDSLAMLAKQEGVRGLFAGVSPRVGKALLSGAIQFATYEETKQSLAKFFQEGR